MDKKNLESYSFIALFGAVSVLLFYVFSPVIQILAFGAVFATIFYPTYKDLSKLLLGWKVIAAGISVAVAVIFIIGPLFFLGTEVADQAHLLFIDVHAHSAEYVHVIQTPIRKIIPGFTLSADETGIDIVSYISDNFPTIVSQTFTLALDTFLMLLAFFFFLLQGESVVTAITQASPFGTSETRTILRGMHGTIDSIVSGLLLVGLIRGVLILGGFYFLGIPNAILWATVAAIVSVVPGLGTPFAFIPAVLYQYFTAGTVPAVEMAIFGGLVIMLMDNMLVPYFFAKGLPVPSVFVLFSLLGGVLFFGPLGFIWGPVVLSVFLTMFQIYSRAPKDMIPGANES